MKTEALLWLSTRMRLWYFEVRCGESRRASDLPTLYAQLSGSTVRITSPANGATVGPVEDITGKGWEPKLNNYLIVEPVDQSGRRWVQGQIASPEWTRSAHFGQGDTPSGMRYRIYVLSTSTALPIGELTKQTDSPQESPAITVTLKK